MAAAHTPGPWTLNPADMAHVIDHEYRVVRAGDGTNYGRHIGFTLCGHISDADAHLIAAAPSMYALLQTAHDFIDNQSDVNCDGDGPNQAMSLAASIRELLDNVDGSAT